VLSSGDTVILSEGDSFALAVEGPDTDTLRFMRDEKVTGSAKCTVNAFGSGTLTCNPATAAPAAAPAEEPAE
jgi:hypothetical protein